jgi:hypothetical protein
MQQPKLITYRGVQMHPDMPELIRRAQEHTTWRIDGKEYPRVRYGDEKLDWGAASRPCPDCAVLKDEFHVESCDIEECPKCGIEMIGCGCKAE